MIRRLILGLFALVALTALAGCGTNTNADVSGGASANGGASTTAGSGGQTVDIKETEYTMSPDKLTLKPGTYTVKLENLGQFPHDVHIASAADGTEVGGSAVATGGQTVTFRVTLKAGEYTMWCAVNAHRSLGMVGSLTVQ
jgi:plastocyanin